VSCIAWSSPQAIAKVWLAKRSKSFIVYLLCFASNMEYLLSFTCFRRKSSFCRLSFVSLNNFCISLEKISLHSILGYILQQWAATLTVAVSTA
jgi:hypothetical protein